MSIFSAQHQKTLQTALLMLATSGAALAVGVFVASPVFDSKAAESCPLVRDLGTAIRLAGKDPRKVCDLDLENQGHRVLPSGIVKLTQLKYLDVTNNKLETLPSEIEALTKLKRLVVRLNKLRTLPAEVGDLKKIELLQLEQNQLTRLPNGFCGVGQNADTPLIELALAQNKLQSLPEDFGACHPLRFLNLSDNLLKTLPESFGQLDIDWILDLRRNELEVLPDSFGELTLGKDGYPTYLYLDDNKLTSLPVFGPKMHVLSLSLRNNRFEHLPQWFFEIPKLPIRYELRSIDLTGNPLAIEEVNALKAVFAAENAKNSSFTGPEIEFPYTYAMLAQLDDSIDRAWERGELEKARELFTQWFTAAEDFRAREPQNEVLASYIAEMRSFEKQLALEADYAQLESRYDAMIDAWQAGKDLEGVKKQFSQWLELASSIASREPANTDLNSWVQTVSGYQKQQELEAGWSQLEAANASIAAAWQSGDLASAKEQLTQWLTIADALAPTEKEDRQFLASWKTDMTAAERELNKLLGSQGDRARRDAAADDLDRRMAEIRQAVEAEEYEKAKPLLQQWLTAARALLAEDPSDEQLASWISDTLELQRELETS